MIYIRVDANSQIGMGHMMRCISIAEALYEKGEKIQFLVASTEATKFLEEKNMPYIVLNTNFANMESEQEVLNKIVKKNTKILVDSYYVTNQYFKFLKKFGRVIYVDDVCKFQYDVDCVINGNIYGDKVNYDVPIQLKGCRYAPIRKEFSEAKKCKKPQNILITTGGSDPYHLTEKILNNLLTDTVLKTEQYDVVCGMFSESYERLCQLQNKYGNVHVHRGVSEMWTLMQSAKIAITAGGTTMTELSCMGIPIVGFSFVDNQKRIVNTFLSKGYAHFGADYESVKDEMFLGICNATKELVLNGQLCEKYSKKLMELVDGTGCQRIAERLINM